MRQLLLGGIVLAALTFTPGVRAAEDEAKAVLLKAIKAHGGEEYLSKHKACISKNKGKINLPGVGEVEFTQEVSYMYPNKFKESLDLEVNGQTVSVVTMVNGDKSSIVANGMEVPITDEIKATLKEAQHMLKVSRLLAPAKEKGYELSIAGEIKVEDKPAVGVRISSKGQKDVTMYFDKKTGLLAKIENRTLDTSTGNEVTEERVIKNYEKNDAGIPLPKKVVVQRDGKKYIQADVIETQQLEKLNDSIFEK